MAKVNVFHDPVGNTLVVWFGEPSEEVEAEETGGEVILIKDQNVTVIGFEKLNFLPGSNASTVFQTVGVSFETMMP
ncbi:MAG: DUF2283 domain-containing protein [Leptolyngbyaceae bacterium]|nr:DUF2283 domain-containing protein [Leptolyngbyaceae bacterium]